MSDPIPVPEGEVAKRPLQFFWLVDHSGSMSGKKISTLNTAIREALPLIRDAVKIHPEVQIEVRAIKFASGAGWHVGPKPVLLDQFAWPELTAGGITATAKAIEMLSTELTIEKMPRRGYPPVCVLVSDGFCTDPTEEYEGAISALTQLPWGMKAVRLAIGVGDRSEYDENELLKFVSHPEIGVLHADTPGKLTEYIKWASTAAAIGASQAKSKGGSGAPDNTNVVLGPAPAIADSTDVF